MSLEKGHTYGLAASVKLFTNINQVLVQRGRIAVHETQLGESFRNALFLLQISNTQETLAMLTRYKSSYFSSVTTCYDSYYPSATVRRLAFFFRLAAQTCYFGTLNFVCNSLSQTVIVNFKISGNGDKFFPDINAPGKYTTKMQSSANSSRNFSLKELLKYYVLRQTQKALL